MSAQTITAEGVRPGSVAMPLDFPAQLPSRVRGWVTHVAGLTRPDAVRWCDGSAAEADSLYSQIVSVGPVLADSDGVSDAACTHAATAVLPETAPTGCPAERALTAPAHVRPQSEAERRRLLAMFAGCMRGRVMYAVPYAGLGQVPTACLGIELTDSPWVVLNLGLAASVGAPALGRICAGHSWAASVHSVGYPLLDEAGNRRPDVTWPCNPEKWIAAFPASGDVWSFGTGFGAAGLAACTTPAVDADRLPGPPGQPA
jgi:phosphoenolpyruvate carboxykinase (GTP)